MTRETATAAIFGATGRCRGGAQVPDALGKALQGRALGLLTMPVPGFAFGSKDRRSGTSEVPVTPGRRLRVDASRPIWPPPDLTHLPPWWSRATAACPWHGLASASADGPYLRRQPAASTRRGYS